MHILQNRMVIQRGRMSAVERDCSRPLTRLSDCLTNCLTVLTGITPQTCTCCPGKAHIPPFSPSSFFPSAFSLQSSVVPSLPSPILTSLAPSMTSLAGNESQTTSVEELRRKAQVRSLRFHESRSV